jgi:hypothetical protein
MRARRAVVLVMLLLAGSIPLSPRPTHAYTLNLTAAEIETVARAYFPQRQEGVFGRITLSDPKVVLEDGSERLGLGVKVKAELPGGLTAYADALVDGEVAWDPAKREFHLREPRVRRLDAEGLQEPYASLVAEGVNALAQETLPVIVLYRVPADAAGAEALKALKRVAVKDGRLRVELGAP